MVIYYIFHITNSGFKYVLAGRFAGGFNLNFVKFKDCPLFVFQLHDILKNVVYVSPES